MMAAGTTSAALKREAAHAWIFYDGDCSFCTAMAARFGPMLTRRHFVLVPLQTPWAQQRLGMKPDEPLTEMKLLAEGGIIFGGADALAQIARRIWWAWPLFAISFLPGIKILLRVLYRQVAMRRHCLSGTCAMPKKAVRHKITTVFFEMP